jgi:hypothetical protein
VAVLLNQFAPTLARVALLYNRNTAPWADNLWRSFQAIVPSFGVTPVQMSVRDAAAIEHAIDPLAREPNGALLRRDFIVALAARHRLPAGLTGGQAMGGVEGET